MFNRTGLSLISLLNECLVVVSAAREYSLLSIEETIASADDCISPF